MIVVSSGLTVNKYGPAWAYMSAGAWSVITGVLKRVAMHSAPW